MAVRNRRPHIRERPSLLLYARHRPLRMTWWSVAAAILACATTASAAPQPNFVVILADDLGWSDVGAFGSEIETPNLDALAAEGARFTDFYVTPRCSPTRAALLTGRQPQAVGMGFLGESDWGRPGYRGRLDPKTPTLPESLADAGYASYMAGKWHLGSGPGPEERPSLPLDRGFDRFFGTLAGSGSFYDPATLMRDADLKRLKEDGWYYTDAISDAAATFVQEHHAHQPHRPFFLYVAYTAPHWPLQAPEEDVARYRGRYAAGFDAVREARHRRQIELGLVDPGGLPARDRDVPAWEDEPHRAWQERRMEVYAAQVDRMDRGIGRVLAALEETGVADDTLVVFLSDNGACAESLGALNRLMALVGFSAPPERTRDGRPVQLGNDPEVMPGPEDTFQSYGAGWAQVSNTPFRGYKQDTYEGGIVSGLIVRWPRGLTLATGGVVREPAHVVDWMPTFLELAGITVPAGLGGSQFGAATAWGCRAASALFFAHQGSGALRLENWKIVSFRGGPWELYDLVSGRTEQNDRASAEPARVAELAAIWEAKAAAVGVEAYPWVIRPFRRAVISAGAVALLLMAIVVQRLRRRRAPVESAGSISRH